MRLLKFLFPILLLNACVHSEVEPNVPDKLLALEKKYGGRIGVSAVNSKNGDKVQFRSGETFPMCSTFKAVLAAAILKKSESDETLLNRRIHYKAEAVVSSGYSPVTQKFQKEGMMVRDLSAATIQFSDNAAANFLLELVDGPKGLTEFARSLGDEHFILERIEPELNSAIPGDLRDTTTPQAMETTLRKLLLGSALSPPSRELFTAWLKGNTTGGKRIRAKLPTSWVVGDKTGTCDYGTANDIGIVWPEGKEPIVLAVYYTQTNKDDKQQEEVVAEASRLVLEKLTRAHSEPESGT